MRKQLRSEIDSLENRIKWLNIAGMPVAVVLAGFWLAAMKRKRAGKMKGKQLALVLVLLVAVGGVALFLNQRNSASWSETATTSSGKVLDFPLNDVSQVTIKEGDAELNLVKKDDVWKVKERADYPADFDKVGALIRKLWELQARAGRKDRPVATRAASADRARPGIEQRHPDRFERRGRQADRRFAPWEKISQESGSTRRRRRRFCRRPLRHGAGWFKPRLPGLGYLRRDPNETGAMAESRFHQGRKPEVDRRRRNDRRR